MLLKHYLQDGADSQARAVLMALQGLGDIESSWDDERKEYKAKVYVGRWENCREQGYVLSLRKLVQSEKKGLLKSTTKQLNIAFFEHRNSDSIHAIKWEQDTINSATIDTAEFGDVYKTKFDTSYYVGFGEYQKMAEWIQKQFKEFWDSNS